MQFNTVNSEFEPDFIAQFATRVMERGGRTCEHRAIRWGRMTQRLTPDEMPRAVDAERDLGD